MRVFSVYFFYRAVFLCENEGGGIRKEPVQVFRSGGNLVRLLLSRFLPTWRIGVFLLLLRRRHYSGNTVCNPGCLKRSLPLPPPPLTTAKKRRLKEICHMMFA